MKIGAKQKQQYQEKILKWYKTSKRNLPWRNRATPYQVLLSEVMSQQTQIERVQEHYKRWLQLFPSWRILAEAPQKKVLQAWSGLGYNRRALNLHKCAKVVYKQYKGKLPQHPKELMELPGIGPYTAHAIAAFAFNQPVATLDTNIARIQHRVLLGPEIPEKDISIKEEWSLAQELFPEHIINHKDWNNALMDLGALICTAKKPQCHHCPLKQQCKAAPKIHRTLNRYYKTKQKPREPGIEENGRMIPNRIFRGRIIECLRKQEQATIEEIGNTIKNDYTTKDAAWLLERIESLEQEGFITIKNTIPTIVQLR